MEVGQQDVGVGSGHVGGAEHVDSAAPDGDRGGIGQSVCGGEHGLLAAVMADQYDGAEAVDRGQDWRTGPGAGECEVVDAGQAGGDRLDGAGGAVRLDGDPQQCPELVVADLHRAVVELQAVGA